jgi:hypothetical protein
MRCVVREQAALSYLLAQGLPHQDLDCGSEWLARIELAQWIHWARRSRLEPFKRIATTIRDCTAGILGYVRSGSPTAGPRDSTARPAPSRVACMDSTAPRGSSHYSPLNLVESRKKDRPRSLRRSIPIRATRTIRRIRNGERSEKRSMLATGAPRSRRSTEGASLAIEAMLGRAPVRGDERAGDDLDECPKGRRARRAIGAYRGWVLRPDTTRRGLHDHEDDQRAQPSSCPQRGRAVQPQASLWLCRMSASISEGSTLRKRGSSARATLTIRSAIG